MRVILIKKNKFLVADFESNNTNQFQKQINHAHVLDILIFVLFDRYFSSIHQLVSLIQPKRPRKINLTAGSK